VNTTRPFWGKFLPLPIGFPKTNKAMYQIWSSCSSSSFEDMFNRMPKI